MPDSDYPKTLWLMPGHGYPEHVEVHHETSRSWVHVEYGREYKYSKREYRIISEAEALEWG